MNTPITEQDLHAYVDDRLSLERRAAVEAYLAEHPVDAERVRAYREQSRVLATLFDSVVEEPVPASIRVVPRIAGQRALKFGGMAASLALAASVGWFARGIDTASRPISQSFAQRALIAHAVYVPEVLHPVEVQASQEQHLTSWLSKRLGTAVRAPNLHGAGFDLVGGRLLPDAPKPAAQFMYQNSQGARLTLYLTPDAEGSATAFRFERNGSISAFYWIDNHVGYALAGEMQRPALLNIAETVYRGLNRQ